MTTGRKNNRKTGAEYERIAGKYLEEHGYEILTYNYRCRMGEIDIVAREGGYLVFCEVKYRTRADRGMPEEAVNFRKQRMISKCALHYLTEHHCVGMACRFDVVAILGISEGSAEETILLYRNAFDYIER